MTAVCRLCKHYNELTSRCSLDPLRWVPPSRPACEKFAPLIAKSDASLISNDAPLISTRTVSLSRRRPKKGKPYVAYTLNVPVDVARAWGAPRKLIATFDGKRLTLEPAPA